MGPPSMELLQKSEDVCNVLPPHLTATCATSHLAAPSLLLLLRLVCALDATCTSCPQIRAHDGEWSTSHALRLLQGGTSSSGCCASLRQLSIIRRTDYYRQVKGLLDWMS